MSKTKLSLSSYKTLVKNGDLAELIGATLGDGHICSYERTQELRITSNAHNIGFVNRYAAMIRRVFGKEPYVIRNGQNNSIKVGFYQKFISERMGIPSGERAHLHIIIPDWILNQRQYIVRYLRGLYEAEGSFCVHKPTYTYKFLFSNKNDSMLANVFDLLKVLGFHPHRSKYQIQISRKNEVYTAKKLLNFRDYK